MNDTEYVALVETSREELRDRIAHARDRFDRLIRTADPQARPPGSDWTVQQVVAHVLSVAYRYRQVARGLDFRRAVDPAEVQVINQAELEAVMAPLPELADRLREVEEEMDSLFDRVSNDRPEILFHFGIMVSGFTGQTNWLSELLAHGQDVARAMKVRWELPERDMLLVLRGMMQVGPAFLRADVPRGADLCVALKIPGARPYVIHVHDGIAEMRELRPQDRPDAVLRVPASTQAQMLYRRMGPIAAVRHGLLVVGGRRPWKAAKLMSYFQTV
jgi:uncharacterized protein (TIGR03083 family)